MRIRKGYWLFISLTLLLTGCTAVDKEKPSANKNITIESYDMSEEEKLLISKTGVSQIEFFKLNGSLTEDDSLQISVEEFEGGKFKKELLSTSDGSNTKLKDSLISFGISNDEDQSLKLLSGVPSGLGTTKYSNNMKMSSFSKLIGEKITLEKNKPVYLVAWLGTTKNSLRSIDSEDGDLPTGIEEAEIALLYKVLWTEKS